MSIKKLSICLAFVCLGCATRKVPAPIINYTEVPNYNQLQAQVATPAPAVNTPSKNSVANDNDPQLGSLDNKNSVHQESIPVTNKPQISQQPSPIKLVSATWIIPTDGNIVQHFTPSNKGIDISGKFGQPIYATNEGKVAYSGNGLKGYGNLIIIKHDNTYLSAYAHNKINLVKDGDKINKGQKIAEMGIGDNNTPLLHFELRQNGKPIDPLSLIK